MSYFDKDFIKFFNELEKNNNREWFTENKKRYEKSVKEPFEHFISDLLKALSEIDGPYPVEAKDCIFRIYKDVRFSKDKTPYKTQASALVTRAGRKGMTEPGIYVEAKSNGLRVYGGLYEVPKEKLSSFRLYLAHNYEEYKRLSADTSFKNHFGEILGEKNKRLPPELMEYAGEAPDIYNKNFYFFAQLPPSDLTDEHLVKKTVDLFLISKDLRHFLYEGLED